MTKDLIDELRDERQMLADLVQRLRDTTDRDVRRQILARVDDEFRAHTEIQQELVYPLLRARASSDEVDEHIRSELAAFGEARNLTSRMRETPVQADHFVDRAQRLANLLASHLGGAGADLLSDTKDLLDDHERRDLGLQAGRRHAELTGHWTGTGRPRRGAM